MRKSVFIIMVCVFQISFGQQEIFSFKKNMVSANYYYASGKTFNENGVQISYDRRVPVEEKIHFEYGANLYFSPNKNPLLYRKNDSIYMTQTAGINFDFGIKMVKEFRVKNANVEWATSLGFGSISFLQNGIPRDEHKNPNTNENTMHIDTNLGGLATMNFGQSLRIFRNNFGIQISANYLPVYWTEKKHLTQNLKIFRLGIGGIFAF